MKGLNGPSPEELVRFNGIAAMMRKRAEQETINCGSPIEDILKYRVSVQIGKKYLLQVIFTRDVGTHTIGFTSNPENERCYNLTFSFQGADGNPLRGTDRIQRIPEMKRIARNLMESFFPEDAPRLLIEPPESEGQKKLQVWGCRLFCNAEWQPLQDPRETGMHLFRDYYALS